MSKTYRAVQAVAPGTLELVEKEVTAPGPGQVRLIVEACGICHTDAATIEGGFPGLAYPRVPGHEVIGRIDGIGAGVTGWRVGQRVGIGFLGGHCHTCPPCRRGDFVSCQRQPMSGVHVDGGYAEVMLAQASGLVAIPDELAPTEAAPLLCAGITTFNALRNSRARAGDLVAIQGVGGLGHLGIQYARHMGFRVAAIARGDAKRELAVRLGAHHYIDSTARDAAAELQALGGARLIVATASSSDAMSALIGGLAERGEMVVAGVGDAPIAVHPAPLLFGQRRVSGTLTGLPIDIEDALAFSVLQGIRPVVETAPLAEAPAAYQRMLSNQARFRIVLTTGL
jgi:propanol-preferring alcohol dehydrogenase